MTTTSLLARRETSWMLFPHSVSCINRLHRKHLFLLPQDDRPNLRNYKKGYEPTSLTATSSAHFSKLILANLIVLIQF